MIGSNIGEQIVDVGGRLFNPDTPQPNNVQSSLSRLAGMRSLAAGGYAPASTVVPAAVTPPTPAVEPTPAAAPTRQTSFTNADVTPELMSRTTIVPGVQAQSSGTDNNDLLRDLITRLTPPPTQARLIRAAPETRVARDPAEAARMRRDRALSISERAQEISAEQQAAGQRQAGLGTAAQIIGQMEARRQQLSQQLAVAQQKASALTPEGRKALAEAERIETELAAIRQGVGAGELSLEQALSYLTGRQTRYEPLAGLTGPVGLLNTATGQTTLFPTDLLNTMQPQAL